MKYFLLIFLLILPAFAVFAKDSDWIGLYSFHEESRDETRERTSSWFRLEIEEAEGKLAGIYSDGINGEVSRRFAVSVKTDGKKAQIFFERALPRDDAPETCSESEFVNGDLLFEFEATTIDGEPAVYTSWQKMNLAARTESGGADGKNRVFFRKYYIKKHPSGFID